MVFNRDLRVTILGNAGVGKTTLIKRLRGEPLDESETLLNYQKTVNDLKSSNIPFNDPEATSFLDNVNQILEITKNSPLGKYPIDNKVVQLFDTYIPNW